MITVRPCPTKLDCPVCDTPLDGISIETPDWPEYTTLSFADRRQLLGEHKDAFGGLAIKSSVVDQSDSDMLADEAAMEAADNAGDALPAFTRPTLNDRHAIPVQFCPECAPIDVPLRGDAPECVNETPFDYLVQAPLQDTEDDMLLDADGKPLLDI